MDRTPDRRQDIPELVRQAQAGDVQAFERLYREHEGRVYAVCLRIIAERNRAEELTQDVFVRVWETLHSFRGESAFSSWLHRVAVNVVLVNIRTEQRYKNRVATVEDVEDYEQAGPPLNPGTSLDLEDAIRALPLQARTVFVLHDIEGFRHEEISEQLGVAVGTTKAQLHRARRLLRKALNR